MTDSYGYLTQLFLDSATTGDTAELEQLLRIRIEPNDALGPAVLAKQAESVRILLQHGAEPNRLVDNRRTALHLAVGTGCAETVRHLLRYKANPYWYCAYDWCWEEDSALDLAWQQRDLAFLQAYIDVMPGGVDAAHPVSGDTLLHWAAKADDKELATFLLRQGAATDLVNYEGLTPRDLLPEHSCLLDSIPKHDKTRQPDKRPLLHRLVELGYLDMVNCMLDWGTPSPYMEFDSQAQSPDLPGPGGNTPLHLAAAAGNVPMVELLLRYRASTSLVNDAKETPLNLAAKNHHTKAMYVLLEAGAN